MRLVGAPAVCGEVVGVELEAAMYEGRPCLIWCDGHDVTAIVGEAGDTAEQLLRVAPRILGEAA